MDIYKCSLRVISSNHSRVRTNKMKGFCIAIPTIGEVFEIFGPPLDVEKNIRVITTTPVVSIEEMHVGKDKIIKFKTRNSLYEWKAR